MRFKVDQMPPPLSLREAIIALEVGQSLLAEESPMATVRTIVSRVRADFKERTFKTSMAEDGPRVWRLA
jgi:hypothetical protein